MKRRWHLLWLVPVLLFGYLWVRAGFDIRYMMRVLVRRDSNTSDYRWKAAREIPKSSHPVPWREVNECPAVAAAFAADGGMDPYLTEGGALAFVVIHDGALACEWYGNGGARDEPAAAFSISKIVTALLLERAHEIPSLEDPITRYIPELADRDPRFGAISLAALVDMRSGIAFDEDTRFPWVDGDAPSVYYASDLAATVVAKPRIESAPGPFVYNDYAPNLLGLALQRATGALPIEALWDELGAEFAASWSVDDRGFPWMESGLVVTARDLARLGQLLLDHGRVGDRTVAPAAYIARSLDPVGRTTAVTFDGTPLGYRNAWWVLGDRALIAMGRHGQIMVVAPATRTVVVRLGLDGHDETNVSIARRLTRVAEAMSSPAAAPPMRSSPP